MPGFIPAPRHAPDVCRSNKVVLQVLTYAAGAHPAMDGAFEILRFPDAADPDVVYLQYRRGSIYLEDPQCRVEERVRADELGAAGA